MYREICVWLTLERMLQIVMLEIMHVSTDFLPRERRLHIECFRWRCLCITRHLTLWAMQISLKLCREADFLVPSQFFLVCVLLNYWWCHCFFPLSRSATPTHSLNKPYLVNTGSFFPPCRLHLFIHSGRSCALTMLQVLFSSGWMQRWPEGWVFFFYGHTQLVNKTNRMISDIFMLKMKKEK